MKHIALCACSLLALAACREPTAVPTFCGIAIFGAGVSSLSVEPSPVFVGKALLLEANQRKEVDEVYYYDCRFDKRVHAQRTPSPTRSKALFVLRLPRLG